MSRNFSITILLGVITLLTLSSCNWFWNEDEETYPPLKQEELVGCWYAASSGSLCHEECYSNNNQYYQITVANLDFTEGYGVYRIDGGTIILNLEIINSVNMNKYSSNRKYNYLIQDSIMKDVNTKEVFIRSDSVYNCQPHWRLHIKPDSWKLP